VVIVGLFVAIISYFISTGFQGWVTIWLGDPVGLAASATTVAAIATLLAVVVGLRGIYIGRALAHEAFEQAEKAIGENRHQFLEAQYNASRPLVVPVAPEMSEQDETDEPITFDWENVNTFVTIQNVGNGIATNIWIALLPPASTSESGYQYVSRFGSPLPAARDAVKVYLRQGAALFHERDSLNEYPLSVPPERAADSAGRADHFIARLNITYLDIFGRKHASIFDMSDRGLWVNVAFLTNMKRDLGDLSRH
jgi:hypothetical protein